MVFEPSLYGPETEALLARAGNGQRGMPLVCPRTVDETVSIRLRRPSRELFTRATRPEAAHAGLWLYFGFFDEAHAVAQDLHTADGSYWHAILHRMEPDASNSGYWFRRTGRHPVFEPLPDAAAALGYDSGHAWDPYAFIDACGRGQNRPLLEQVQLAEWQLLFHYCAQPRS